MVINAKELDSNATFEQKASVALRNSNLTHVPGAVLTLKNVVHIDLSSNQLTRFPGSVVAIELTRLESLYLQSNLLFSLEDILELSKCPRLRDLNVLQNPLRLLHNRIYFLEALFHQEGPVNSILCAVAKDSSLRNKEIGKTQLVSENLYRERLPHSDCDNVEKERGKPIEYFGTLVLKKKGGDRPSAYQRLQDKFMKQTHPPAFMQHDKRKQKDALPKVYSLKGFQVDATDYTNITNEEGECKNLQDANTQYSYKAMDANDSEECEVARRLYGQARSDNTDIISAGEINIEGQKIADGENACHAVSASWNNSISTIEDLTDDEYHYVRHRFDQKIDSSQRDPTFFTSSSFLNHVVQAERSRSLTTHAVSVLYNGLQFNVDSIDRNECRSMSEEVARLPSRLQHKFSKEKMHEKYETLLDAQGRSEQVANSSILFSSTDYIMNEHCKQKLKTTKLLSNFDEAFIAHNNQRKQARIQANPNESLSKVKLMNAIDLAATVSDRKQEKRLMQMLIDADKAAIEEERISQIHEGHQQRLKEIYLRPTHIHGMEESQHRVNTPAKASASPWQQRNWRANDAKCKSKAMSCKSNATTEDPKVILSPNTESHEDSHLRLSALTIRSLSAFNSIETVDQAMQDTLESVNSHDLLVHCANIRQRTKSDLIGLASYRDRFLRDETKWETMRQDPVNVLRRHLQRTLPQDNPSVTLGDTSYVYSSLFK